MKKICLLATLALAACSNNQSPPSASQGATSTTPAATTPAAASALPVGTAQPFVQGTPFAGADFAVSGASLSVSPNPYSRCDFPKGKAIVTIDYDATGAGVKHSQIWLQQRNGKQALWGQNPGRMPAPAKTGAWAHDGMRAMVINLDDKTMVAVATIHADACKH